MPHEITITFTLDTHLSEEQLNKILEVAQDGQYGSQTIAMIASLGVIDHWFTEPKKIEPTEEKDSVTIKVKTFVPVAPEEGDSSHILFWCNCDEDHETTYHDDEYDDAGDRVSKHHYTCNVCNGITQVG